ncbi:MAG: hypothetical protein ACK5AZ_07980 [Bryobacteraceae bacterium]
MNTYRFVGSYCEIDNGRIKLERFGQRIELPENVAETIIRGGGAILPEAEFNAIGFTEQELELYAYPGQQATAPGAFQRKRAKAHRKFCELLNAPASAHREEEEG